MDRLGRLLSTRRGRLRAVVAELVLWGCVTLLGRFVVRSVRAAQVARAQSQQACSAGAPHACPDGATCETVQGASRCAGNFEDPQSLWQEAHAWVGRRVVIRHAQLTTDLAWYMCTQMACSNAEPCCNSCQGRARLVNAAFRELVDVACLGNECEEPACGIDEHGAFWVFKKDFELHGRVRDNGDSLSIDEVSIGGHVAPRRDILGRPLD
jgi:hypothetical protein